ncbi:tyrosyl-tRNA synthetase, putative [Entamoeba dispar SAW760]|uniref:tyrosine--tRNA ligase n=1 Tax=Entamoeba dispar (strain ATCC PRA-260 / SAW760) TaxID=370354 RepID=B0EKC4_ENTDS|nr:tyrosyl-tRNA synthetase, putative [Entamoeba dispar SAW760]EDR25011.1 tyrosyl-tRNA synthetase, putative [Entamoeba dispar SAW760]|eukprot:EDR25011.1 tyrosyl-tRNA synthetase, putative [Entamoeba dispar SAW760]
MATTNPSGLTQEEIEARITKLLGAVEECDTINDLRALFKEKSHFVAYNGFEPSGRIHIAQAVMTVINANKIHECGGLYKIYIADWFAQLNHKMGGDLSKIQILGKYFIEVFKACGIQEGAAEFVWASDLIQNSKTYWPLVLDIATKNTVNRITRCSQIMGRDEKDALSTSQLIYPCMQCADIFELGADVCQLGLDQRKVNMLAREYAPTVNRKAPIVLSHHMLMGLKGPKAGKMSKSIPDSAIFMDDSYEEIKRKISKAFCTDEVANNPIYEYLRYVIVPYLQKVTLCGKEYTLEDIVPGYREKDEEGKILIAKPKFMEEFKAMDKKQLKEDVARLINDIVEPVRKHFETEEGKKLLATVQSFNNATTR